MNTQQFFHSPTHGHFNYFQDLVFLFACFCLFIYLFSVFSFLKSGLCKYLCVYSDILMQWIYCTGYTSSVKESVYVYKFT